MSCSKDRFPVIQQAALERLRGLQLPGGGDAFSDIVEAYLETSLHHMEVLQDLSRTGERGEQILDAVHTLKSSSANVGALHLADLLLRMEKFLLEKKVDQATDLLAVVNSEYQLVVEHLLGEIRSL